jgi:hypothetical protein
MRFAAAIFLAVASLFVAVGVTQVLAQQERLRAAWGVPATITRSEVVVSSERTAKGRTTTRYRPNVGFRFEADGSIVTAGQVFPLGASGTSKARAERVVADHPVGKRVTVYRYDRNDPSKAFLLREWDFAPYMIILFCVGFLSLGVGFWAAGRGRRVHDWPARRVEGAGGGVSGGSGAHELTVETPLRARRHPYRAASLAWYVIGGVAIGHYLMHADRPYATEAYWLIPLFLLLGLMPLVLYFRHLRVARVVDDPRVTVNAGVLRPGRTFDVKVEQPFQTHAHVEAVRVGLVCRQTVRTQRRARHAAVTATRVEQWAEVPVDGEAGPGRPLVARAKLTPPADAPASTPGVGPLPRVRWRLVVEVRIAGRAGYRGEFPVEVGE